MNSEKIDEFMGTFKNIHDTTFIHKDIIYLKRSDDIVKDKYLNEDLDKKSYEYIINKLNIKSDL